MKTKVDTAFATEKHDREEGATSSIENIMIIR